MNSWRIFAVALATGFVVAVAPSCGPTQQCNAANCSTGCCDADGQCQIGTLQNACGSSGATCQVCPSGTTCSIGLCAATTGGGGDGGTTGDGGMNTGGSLTIDQLCTSVGPAYCKYLVRCGLYATEAGCMNAFGTQFLQGDCAPAEKAALKDGRVVFHGDRAKSCLDFIANTATCESFFGATTEDCETTFEGKVTTNGTCYSSSECVAGNDCSATNLTCPGQCTAIVYRGAGEALMGPDDACQDELYPYNGSTGAVCQAYVAVGGSCAPINGGFNNQYCVDTAYCDSSDICQAKKTQGQPCSSSSSECAGTLQCMNGTCQKLVGLNGTCSSSSGLQCQGDLYCDVAPGMTAGACKDRGAQGASCLHDGYCEQGFFCNGENLSTTPAMPGVCTATLTTGAPCNGNAECNSANYCGNTNTCAAKKPLGGACMDTEECSDGSCDNGICTDYGCSDPTP